MYTLSHIKSFFFFPPAATAPSSTIMNEIPPRLDAMCIEESAETGQGEEAAQAEPDQDNVRLYEQVLKSIEDMAVHLRPLIESKHVVSPCINFSRIERQIIVTGHTYDIFRNNYRIANIGHAFGGNRS